VRTLSRGAEVELELGDEVVITPWFSHLRLGWTGNRLAFDRGQGGQVELDQVQLAGTMDTAVMLSLFENGYAGGEGISSG